jgi:hypothetical protein
MKNDWVGSTHIRCSDCKEVKLKEEYPWSTSNSRSGYYFSYCKLCRKERQRIHRLNRSPWKERASKIGRRASLSGIPFNLDGDYLENLWELQEGLCFYTGYRMVGSVGNGLTEYSVSVDKIIPEIGYLKGNVVLCTHRANTIKNNLTLSEMELWMPSWYERIKMWREIGLTCLQVAEGDF